MTPEEFRELFTATYEPSLDVMSRISYFKDAVDIDKKIWVNKFSGQVGFRGLALQSDVVQPSGRIYPHHLLKDMVEKVSKTRTPILGWANGEYYNIKTASHVIHGCRIVGDKLYVKAETTDTKEGRVLANSLIMGTNVKMFPVGVGRVDTNGVVSEYSLDTFNVLKL